jgi:hypothetical protein
MMSPAAAKAPPATKGAAATAIQMTVSRIHAKESMIRTFDGLGSCRTGAAYSRTRFTRYKSKLD